MVVRRIDVILGKNGRLPVYKSQLSAGADLYAANDKEIILQPNQRMLIPTRLRIELPEDAEAEVRPRSGMVLKEGLVSYVGTIDADYQGEIGIILHNVSDKPRTIRCGERYAQIVFIGAGGLFQADFRRVSCFTRKSERGEGGFGSTGKE